MEFPPFLDTENDIWHCKDFGLGIYTRSLVASSFVSGFGVFLSTAQARQAPTGFELTNILNFEFGAYTEQDYAARCLKQYRQYLNGDLPSSKILKFLTEPPDPLWTLEAVAMNSDQFEERALQERPSVSEAKSSTVSKMNGGENFFSNGAEELIAMLCKLSAEDPGSIHSHKAFGPDNAEIGPPD